MEVTLFSQFTESDAPRLLYGTSATPAIVSVEPAGANEVQVFQRLPNGDTSLHTEPFAPWMVVTRSSFLASRRGVDTTALEGDFPLSTLVSFPNRAEFRNAAENVSNDDYSVLAIKSPVSQYLIESGNTLFKEMKFEDLRRLQLDIETLGLDPEVPDAEVIMVALRQGDHEDVLVQDSTEADLLERLVVAIRELDPDVIEGHNIFLFDLPYLIERARQTGVELGIGRDGSSPTLAQFRSNFRVGPVSLPYTSVHVRGRHIIDTYQQIQRWDVQGKLSSYGLKSIMRELELEREDRVHVEGEQIANMWRAGQRSRDQLVQYALDDVGMSSVSRE
jgi:DNA polymerase elongation subunit (family B)